MWSDLRTTYRLLSVSDGPDQTVEVAVCHGAQIKMLNNSPQHPGVGLGQSLSVRFDFEFSSNVLMQET